MSQAQTVLIDPAGAGGFELGATLAANGWSSANGTATNKWFTGNVPTGFTNNSAYISNTSGSTWNYSNTASSVVHFWRDVTFPAGQINIALSFNWKAAGESSSLGLTDALMVSLAPTSYTPAVSTSSTTYTTLPAPAINLVSLNLQSASTQTANISIPFSITGNCSSATTWRLIFTWKNNGNTGTNPPAAVDNISLTTVGGSPLSGVYSVGPTGNFSTLTAALNSLRINGAANAVIFELQPGYISSSETFPLTLMPYCGASATNTVTIRPASSATGRVISSSTSAQTFNIEGGQYYRIDGRPGGTGSAKELSIENTNLSGIAVRYLNEGSNNILRYCTVRGVNNIDTSGVIVLGTTLGANGNDNNLIEFCDIRDGATTPANCVYGKGSSSAPNNFLQISNCNIYNFFRASANCSGINLAAYHSDVTISNNSFYQTADRTQNGIFTGILGGSTAVSNWTVNDNYIGGTAPNCGGTPLTFLSGGIVFRGINLEGVSNTAIPSLVQGNTLSNINITTTFNNSLTDHFGISCSSGSFNISDNTIGSATSAGSFVLSSSGNIIFYAIRSVPSTVNTASITISNNIISGIDLPGSGSLFFRGIRVGNTPLALTLSNNTVGGTLANSIYKTSQGSAFGISCSPTSAVSAVVSGNSVSNLTCDNATSTTLQLKGIELTGSNASYQVSNNTVANLSNMSANTGTGTSSALIGLQLSADGNNSLVSGNTISALSSTAPSGAVTVSGLLIASTATGGKVERNLVHSLSALSSGVAILNGITNRSAGSYTFQNNMVRLGIDKDGADITGNYEINGILESFGTNHFYHNSVYVGGSGISDGTAATFALRSNVSSGNRNYLNNILYNTRSNGTGSGKHYAIQVGGTAPPLTGLTSNHNDLLATGTGGFTGRFNSLDQATLEDWRTATGQDGNSINSNPQYINPTGNAATVDLHISATTPTVVESGGISVPGVADDYDGQSRSGLTPVDIGADAGNFIGLDLIPPVISYMEQSLACGTGDITLAGVNITDVSGIPTSGQLVPRVYYRKGSGAWFSQAGTLTSGTATNSNWSFTMLASDMGGLTVGDVVSYYIIAQDVATTPNLTSNPAGAVAVSVNSVTTPPVSPRLSTVSNILTGTYTVGVGQDFATLTAAVAAYNSSCLGGPVVFLLSDENYGNQETFPITINQHPDASATNTLTIKPAISTTISGSPVSGLIRLNGADYITIDGAKEGGTDRSLTLQNTSTSSNSACLAVQSLGPGAGATNNTIKNLNIIAGANNLPGIFGIYVGGGSISVTGTGDDNDHLTIQNNSIQRANYGIYARGTTAGMLDGLLIAQNTIGSNTASHYIRFRGILLQNANAPVVSGNAVFNLITANLIEDIAAIDLAANVQNARIVRNDIRGIRNTDLLGGKGAFGIYLSSTAAPVTDNTLIANNFISDILCANNQAVYGNNAHGIHLAGGTNTKVYNNSVNLFGYVTGGNNPSFSANLVISDTEATGTELKNNIFKNTQQFQIATSNIYNIILISGATLAASDDNILNGASSTGTNYHVGNIGGIQHATLAAWQTATGKDANSYIFNAPFLSDTDLHIHPAVGTAAEGNGAVLAAVTDDFDGNPRSLSKPDIGADEGDFTALPTKDIRATLFAAPTAGSTKISATAFTVQATFENAGLVTQTSIPVRFRITGPLPATTVVYNQTANISTLASAISKTVTFANATILTPGTYAITARSELTGDQNTANDEITGTLSVEMPLNGVYDVGSAQAAPFNTLTHALRRLDTLGVSGPVTFRLTDANYSSSETFPMVVNAFAGASAVNTLTIRPAATATIAASSSPCLIRLNGADFVVIDGSNAGGSDRSLTLENTATSTGTACICVQSLGAGAGATNNTIKNSVILAGSNTVGSVFGIFAGGSSISSSGSGDDNDNLTIQNNSIQRAYFGIYARGTSTGMMDSLLIAGNSIGSNAPANYVLFRGMQVQAANAPVISKNTVFNLISNIVSVTAFAGIDLAANVQNGKVLSNHIYGIRSKNASGTGTYGIVLSSSTTPVTNNTLIANNFITDLQGYNFSAGTTRHAYGIRLAGGTNTKVYHNSVNLYGYVSGGTSASTSANFIITSSVVTGTELRNNIFRNTQQFAEATSNTYNIYMPSSVTLAASDDNILYGVSGPNTNYHVAYNGANRSTLADWQAASGMDANSFAANPSFLSDADLHIHSLPGLPEQGNGAVLPAVTDDFDGDPRSAAQPDIGADEFGLPSACQGIPAPGNTQSSATLICPGVIFTLTLSNSSSPQPGVAYQWQSSPDGMAWTDINQATNANLDATLTVSTWYRCKVTCTSTGEMAPSTPLQINLNSDFCLCANYCEPLHDPNNSHCISSVIFNTLNNNTAGNCAAGNYSFHSATTTLVKGSGYNLIVVASPSARASAWIDFNQNEIFDTWEWYEVFFSGATDTISIVVPDTALSGTTRLRIRSAFAGTSIGAANACSSFSTGETEEYCITIVCPLWYQDGDGDGYGNALVSQESCSQPPGYVANNQDCDDGNAGIRPGAPENCSNGADDDCDGMVDESIITWTGNGADSDWSNGANWDNGGGVPTDCHDIVIPAGSTVAVPAGTEAIGKTMQVDFSAVLSLALTAILTIIP